MSAGRLWASGFISEYGRRQASRRRDWSLKKKRIDMRYWTISCTASIGLAVLLAACSMPSAKDGGGTTVAIAKAPVAAQVAVYRSIFASNASALQGRAAAYCIGTGAGTSLVDPDQAVLTALDDNLKVKSASACDTGPKGERVIDRQSRQPALLFGVETVSCVSVDDCTLYGGYYEGNASSQRNLYRARQANGRWTVIMETRGAIS